MLIKNKNSRANLVMHRWCVKIMFEHFPIINVERLLKSKTMKYFEIVKRKTKRKS